MKRGTLYGIHAEASSQAVPLMEKYQAAGAQVACLLAHENPGLCVDAKRINPSIVTIARWHNPVHKWEGGQDVFHWSASERQAFAEASIQLIFDRTNDTEYQASDYFCPGLNEWDPPEGAGAGYRAMADVLKLLCQEAQRRSPEMTARGLHPIQLAIPGFNNGTPEWVEMLAMRESGLFKLMEARGDLLMVHEGVWWDEPITQGFGDLIPGAPSVPDNAGSKCGRFNYWYGGLGIRVPFVVSEWYDGNKRVTPPDVRLAAMKWYDRLVRRNPYCRGFCPFELTDLVDGPWWQVDFTPTFRSQAMLEDMIAQKDVLNPIGGSMDTETTDYINTRLNTIDQASKEIRAKVNQPAALYEAITINADLVLRDAAGNPAHTPDRTLAQPGTPGDIVKVGTRVKVYKDNVAAGVYPSRAWVTPEGLNIATVVTTQSGQRVPTLQRL